MPDGPLAPDGLVDGALAEDVLVAGDVIRLGQLLKLAGLVETGGAVKEALSHGLVTVNGVVDRLRGAQLGDGDVVRCGGRTVRVAVAG